MLETSDPLGSPKTSSHYHGYTETQILNEPDVNVSLENEELSRYDLILKAAAKEFAVHGYAGTSLQSIAARAGVAKGLIFHHYLSKKNLYIVVLRQAYVELLVAVEPFVHQDVPFMEMLLGSVNAKLRYFVEHPDSYCLIYNAFQRPDTAVACEAREIYREQYDHAQRLLQEKITSLPLRPEVSGEEALGLVLAVMEYAQRALIERYGDNAGLLLQQVDEIKGAFQRQLDLLFHGLLQ